MNEFKLFWLLLLSSSAIPQRRLQSQTKLNIIFVFVTFRNYILLLSVDALFFLYLAMFDDVTSVWDCNAGVFVICKMYKIAGTRSR